jgi:hypothetical protein
MSAPTKNEPRLSQAVHNSVRALRRVVDYRFPPALDRQMLELGERKEFLSAEEHEQLTALVTFSEERTADKLQAEIALRQLQSLFPNEPGGVSVVGPG